MPTMKIVTTLLAALARCLDASGAPAQDLREPAGS
jgi:hypothetical protein